MIDDFCKDGLAENILIHSVIFAYTRLFTVKQENLGSVGLYLNNNNSPCSRAQGSMATLPLSENFNNVKWLS